MIREFFKSFGVFSEEEIDEIESYFTKRSIKKNEVFLQEGTKCTEIAFVVKGIYRSYYTGSDGVETTYCFCFPGSLMSSYSAFISGEPSSETLQALTDAEILVVKKSDLDQLSENSFKWMHVLKTIAEQQYVALEQRIFQLQREGASEKYNTLLERQPIYIQKIPLHYLASYLGISQRHLSRIRKGV